MTRSSRPFRDSKFRNLLVRFGPQLQELFFANGAVRFKPVLSLYMIHCDVFTIFHPVEEAP